MTLDQKIALLIGFALSLTVGVLISDHVSRGADAELASQVSVAPPPVVAWVDEKPTTQPTTRLSASTDRPEPLNILVEPQPRQVASIERSVPVEQPRRRTLRPSARIEPGRTPRPSFTTVSDPPAIASEVEQRPETGETVRYEVHHVRSGESLFAICKTFYGNGHLWRALASFNEDRLGSKNKLQVGLRLRMPPASVLMAMPDPSDVAIEATPRERMGEYIVQRGDTLGEISYKLLGTSRRVDELLRLNSEVIRDRNVIRPGTVLRYPMGPDA